MSDEIATPDAEALAAAAAAVAVPPVDDQAAPPAVDDGTITPPAETELPFKLEDVDENFTLTGPEARKWLLTRQAQLQAPVTRATQELAAQRAAIAGYEDIITRLNAEDTRRGALRDVLNQFGYDLPDEEDVPPDPAAGALEEPPVQDPRVDAIIAEREAEKATAAEQRRVEAFQADVVTKMTAFAKEQGLEDHTKIDEADRDDIINRAVVLPRLADGLLDFDGAIAAHLAYNEHVSGLSREAYLKSKEAPDPGVTTGPAGETVVDLTDTKTRLERANAVAGRHY